MLFAKGNRMNDGMTDFSVQPTLRSPFSLPKHGNHRLA
jgi:hypothetical protein